VGAGPHLAWFYARVMTLDGVPVSYLMHMLAKVLSDGISSRI